CRCLSSRCSSSPRSTTRPSGSGLSFPRQRSSFFRSSFRGSAARYTRDPDDRPGDLGAHRGVARADRAYARGEEPRRALRGVAAARRGDRREGRGGPSGDGPLPPAAREAPVVRPLDGVRRRVEEVRQNIDLLQRELAAQEEVARFFQMPEWDRWALVVEGQRRRWQEELLAANDLESVYGAQGKLLGRREILGRATPEGIDERRQRVSEELERHRKALASLEAPLRSVEERLGE